MTLQQLIDAAKKQQELTGRADAGVTLLMPGKWPRGGYKRLFKQSGPKGGCVTEHENAVLCVFKANEVIEAVEARLKQVGG